jgi:hypothetical protein
MIQNLRKVSLQPQRLFSVNETGIAVVQFKNRGVTNELEWRKDVSSHLVRDDVWLK